MQSSLPKISIVTISYNQEEFVEQTMRSVLDQCYPNLEYIVIDGASKDKSPQIIRRYADKLSYFVSEPDKGPADAINKGFAHATGEIMGWINSSDIHYPWTLRTIAQVFTDLPQVDWITGVASHLDEGIYPQDVAVAFHNKYDYLSGHFGHIQQESTFWRRRLWDAAGGSLDITLRHVFELSLWLRFARLTPLYQVNTILAGYRLHGDRIEPSEKDRKRHEALLKEFRDSFGPLDRFRGRFLGATDNPPGRTLRSLLKRFGLMGWNRKPRIVRDFDNNNKHWVILEYGRCRPNPPPESRWPPSS